MPWNSGSQRRRRREEEFDPADAMEKMVVGVMGQVLQDEMTRATDPDYAVKSQLQRENLSQARTYNQQAQFNLQQDIENDSMIREKLALENRNATLIEADNQRKSVQAAREDSLRLQVPGALNGIYRLDPNDVDFDTKLDTIMQGNSELLPLEEVSAAIKMKKDAQAAAAAIREKRIGELGVDAPVSWREDGVRFYDPNKLGGMIARAEGRKLVAAAAAAQVIDPIEANEWDEDFRTNTDSDGHLEFFKEKFGPLVAGKQAKLKTEAERETRAKILIEGSRVPEDSPLGGAAIEAIKETSPEIRKTMETAELKTVVESERGWDAELSTNPGRRKEEELSNQIKNSRTSRARTVDLSKPEAEWGLLSDDETIRIQFDDGPGGVPAPVVRKYLIPTGYKDSDEFKARVKAEAPGAIWFTQTGRATTASQLKKALGLESSSEPAAAVPPEDSGNGLSRDAIRKVRDTLPPADDWKQARKLAKDAMKIHMDSNVRAEPGRHPARVLMFGKVAKALGITESIREQVGGSTIDKITEPWEQVANSEELMRRFDALPEDEQAPVWADIYASLRT